MIHYSSILINGHTATIDTYQAHSIAAAIANEIDGQTDTIIDVDMGEEFIPCHVTLNDDGLVDTLAFGRWDDYILTHSGLQAVNNALCALQMKSEQLPF